MDHCTHARTKRGLNIPLRYGSHRSEVCISCGSFRHIAHSSDRRPIGGWKPASQYEAATEETELE
jgi:hypothetical protein